MDINIIKKLVKLLDTSGITDLEVEENGFRVKISKKNEAAPQHNVQPVTTTIIPHSEVQKAEEEPPASEKEEEEVKKNLHEVKSPIVGTFYRAPAPDADPYVQVGDSISAGSVLCIVEAMKLMNEIECDVNGTIEKILVDNGKPVEYNQPLFLVKTS